MNLRHLPGDRRRDILADLRGRRVRIRYETSHGTVDTYEGTLVTVALPLYTARISEQVVLTGADDGQPLALSVCLSARSILTVEEL